MYKIEWKKEIPMLLTLILAVLATAWLYPSLPERLPIHWNIQGQIDGWLDKSWPAALWMPLLCLVLYLLMLFVPFLDPRRERYGEFLRPYRRIRLGLTVYFLFIAGVVLSAASNPEWPVDRIIASSVGLLLVVIGNFLGKIRSNWFVGIRFPWTLENEEVWNRTHRLGGRLFVLIGFLTLLAGLFLPRVWTAVILLSGVAGMIAGLAVYSYRLHRSLSRR